MPDMYRVGRSLGRTVYRQVGDEWSKADVLLGIFDDKVVAARVVELLNGESSLRADLDRAEQALKAVRELHRPAHVEYPPPEYETPYCDECTNDWPCPTVLAINDAFTVTSPPNVREWLKRTAPDGEAKDG